MVIKNKLVYLIQMNVHEGKGTQKIINEEKLSNE
jgi:hypothetical protein